MYKIFNQTLKFSLFLFAVMAYATACAQDFKDIAPNLDQVQPDSIRAHIKYLADDRLRGRLPGTPGYQLAMDYVISQFKRMGVEPAGENSGFLQTVKFRRARVDKDNTFATFITGETSKELVFGDGFVLSPNFEENKVEITAPLVFVGYGVSEPELGYDDYAGIDVKGKIVVMITGAPDKFPSTVRAHVMNRVTRAKAALEKGAIAVIVRGGPTGLQNLVQGLVKTGSVVVPDNMVRGLKFSGSVSQSVFSSMLNVSEAEAAKIFLSLKEGKPNSFELRSSLKVSLSTKYEDFESYNVVGLIRGSDKALKDEYVVYSAHLDHMGVGTPVKGDSIYNGAHDNASGVSCVLEVARIYSSLKQKPKRSVLAVMVVGEEMGLLGSGYFAAHPTVPKEKIVANVNMDMPTLIAPLLSVVPLGAVHSSLMTQVKTAASYLGLDVEDDPEPDQNRFVRSDQYSFVQQGIPALNIKYGDKTNEPGVKLTEKVKVWRASTYHQPQDEFIEANFDFNAARKYVQLCFLIGYQVAKDKARPTWNKGDLFGKKFGNLK
jgi:hypothetical protein